MKISLKTILVLFLLPLQLIAQDITGLWTGFLKLDGTNLPYELVISKTGDELSGYSITVFTINNVENMGVKSIILKNKNGNIFVEDNDLVYNNYTTPPKRVKQYNFLILKVEDSIMTLKGTFRTRSFESRPYYGTVQLQKRNISTPSKLISKLEEIDLLNTLSFVKPTIKQTEVTAVSVSVQPKIILPKENDNGIVLKEEKKQTPNTPVDKIKKEVSVVYQPPTDKKLPAISPKEKVKPAPIVAKPIQNKKVEIVSVPKPNNAIATPPSIKRIQEILPSIGVAELASRKIETIRIVLIKSDSLLLTLYDNGEIDGDTVSVLLNGKIILLKQGLNANAIKKTIYFTPELGDSMQVIMYAENLGRIPPNTGLLILQDGDDRYEIRFAGDLQKNSAIILKRKH